MIQIYNRQKAGYEVEKVVSEGLIKYLYGTGYGKLGLELLVKRKLYSFLVGAACDMRLSSRKIRGFVEKFGIDMSQCADDVESFKTFNDFFTRRLKHEARPFDRDPCRLLSPGDGRMRAWKSIDIKKLTQIKGITYKLSELLPDKKLAQKYDKGIYIVLRLAPVDYHRFHFIDNGMCSPARRIKGSYYSVNPIALNEIAEIFCKNKREYSILHSENFGDILYIEIGATSVGSIIQTYSPERRVIRGQEKGYFKFGGSTIILLLEEGTASIDEDILEQTEKGYEVRVLAGEAIGKRPSIH